MEKQEHIKHIFFQYVKGERTKENLELLLNELASDDSDGNGLERLIEEALENAHGLEKLEPEINRIGQSTLQTLRQEIKPKSSPIRLLFKIAASVVAIAGLSIVLYQYAQNTDANQPAVERNVSVQTDVAPGRNQAVISIGDGEDMVLDDGQSGIAVSNNEIRYADGEALAKIKADDIVQVRTPKGGQFQVTLSDGTKVWLNAESTLRYPSQFGGTERRVTLIGEAYFEVSKESGRSKRSFVVASNKQDIVVLGTHFNISVYPDEPLSTTTLVEGAVNVIAKNSSHTAGHAVKGKGVSKILRPGQQSVLKDGVLNVGTADIEQALAWKNNMFIFNNMPLEDVMKTIARWYDVDIYYQNKSATNEVYAGSITRYENLSKVLHMLEKAGDTRFRLEEGRVVVMK